MVEILICMVIITLVGGFFSMKGYQLLCERKSNAAVKKLSDEVYLTKVLSLTHKIDIEMSFQQEGNKLIVKRGADYIPKAIRMHFESDIDCPQIVLKEPQMKITFYSSGLIDPDDSLEISFAQRPECKKTIKCDCPRKIFVKEQTNISK